LQESAALARRIAERARRDQHDFAAAKFEEKSRQAEKQAALIRDMLLDPETKSVAARAE
jgi:hypothetical protein